MGSFLFSTLLFTFCKKNNSIESATQCSISPRLESWKHIITGNELKESRSRSSFCLPKPNQRKTWNTVSYEKPHTKQTKDFKQKIRKKANKTRKEKGTDRSRLNSQNDI